MLVRTMHINIYDSEAYLRDLVRTLDLNIECEAV